MSCLLRNKDDLDLLKIRNYLKKIKLASLKISIYSEKFVWKEGKMVGQNTQRTKVTYT